MGAPGAAILASRLQNAAVVTTPHSPEPRMRLLELVSVHDYLALLVVVLQEARVLQQTLSLERPMSQEELTTIARKLNEALAGKTAAEMRAPKVELTPVENSVVEAAAGLIESTDEAGIEPSFLDGMRDLLGQPEFTRASASWRCLKCWKNATSPAPFLYSNRAARTLTSSSAASIRSMR